MGEAHGIKESKELFGFVAKLCASIAQSMKDGKFEAEDLTHFMPLLVAAPAAFEKVGEMPKELKDLSEEEVVELMTHFSTELVIPQEDIKEVVSKGVAAGVAIYGLVMAILELKK